MISGFLGPDEGKVSLARVPMASSIRPPTRPISPPSAWAAPSRIVQPFAAMTVEENIMVGAFYRHPDERTPDAAARETAWRMGLARC